MHTCLTWSVPTYCTPCISDIMYVFQPAVSPLEQREEPHEAGDSPSASSTRRLSDESVRRVAGELGWRRRPGAGTQLANLLLSFSKGIQFLMREKPVLWTSLLDQGGSWTVPLFPALSPFIAHPAGCSPLPFSFPLGGKKNKTQLPFVFFPLFQSKR